MSVNTHNARYAVWLAGPMLGLLLAGCTPAPVTVTEGTPCLPLQLTVGQSLMLALPASPSTGYRWVLGTLPPGMSQVGETHYAPTADKARLGAAGQMHWRLDTTARGTGTLSLDYVRLWDKGAAPARTFRCPVQVAE